MPMLSASADGPPPFLDREPPHWAARGLGYLVMLIVAAAVAVAVLVRIPEVVQMPFVLVPAGGSDPVRSPRRGVVLEVRVRDGDRVAADGTIAVIGSDEAGDRWSELRTLDTQLAGAEQALSNLRGTRTSLRFADREEERGLSDRLADLDRMLIVRQEQIALSEDVLARRRRLFDDGLTSLEDVARSELEHRERSLTLAELQSQRVSAARSLQQLAHEIEAREVAFREEERRLREQAETSRIRANLLRGGAGRGQGTVVEASAPCSGTVIKLDVRARGAVVQEGDSLAVVACEGERLHAELGLPQTGLGRLAAGQGVKLLYDAFPYQRFGVRYGTVRWVSPSAVPMGTESRFRVIVEPEPSVFLVEGEPRTPIPGMTGTAHVVVGRRTLLEYALAPMRQVRERFDAPPAPR